MDHLYVEHCAGDIQLADIMTKVLPGVRQEYLAGLIGLGPQVSGAQTSFVRVEAVQAPVVGAEAMPPNPATAFRAANALVLLILLHQVLECRSEGDEDDDNEPVNFDLYVMLLLMTFSVLFIWESGKYCLQRTVRRVSDEEPLVRVAHEDNDEHRLKRERRQEAVRRVIERESEGLRRRLKNEEDDLTAPIVNVQVTTSVPTSSVPDPAPPPPPPFVPPPCGLTNSGGLGLPPEGEGLSASTSSCSSKGVATGSVRRRDCATQTDGSQGLTYEQMCGLETITTSSRTPGALHIFPECHALRNVTSTNRRMFCRYCIQSLRHQNRVG